MKRTLLNLLLLLLMSAITFPQNDTILHFEDYNPPSSLVVPEHIVERAKYPFIDAHNHQFDMSPKKLNKVITGMDKLNMAVMVNLEKYSGRFITFTNVDFNGIGEEGWLERILEEIESDVGNGANGLKIYKNLGLTQKDNNGNRVPVDDPRLDRVWGKCAELNIPVLIHTGEPFQFWQPHDKNNERWLELKQRPNRYRDPEIFPPWEVVMEEQHNVFRKHPKTIFINAHLGWLGFDLNRLGELMDELPNMYTEIGAVLAELGRQPRQARQWFIKYQDRILFGKDSWNPEEYYVYFRVLETADEYFDYYRKRHAFWKMYGMDLPDEVLKKVYYKNALKIIPGIDKSLFPD
jgi:predicted TIM-barrel fold metal-dependent hydrolase